MDEEYGAAASRYFCHMCSLIIRPELGIEEVKCPHCHTGFVEEVAVDSRGGEEVHEHGRPERDLALQRGFRGVHARLAGSTPWDRRAAGAS